MRNFIQITITKKGENRARMGHPWVFEGEVLKESEKPENGSLVDVVSEKGKYIGTGFYNDHSKIRVRLLSYNANDRFDEAFFERRVRYAVDYRKTVMPGADFACCRLIFGEADGFPGLTTSLSPRSCPLGWNAIKTRSFPFSCACCGKWASASKVSMNAMMSRSVSWKV